MQRWLSYPLHCYLTCALAILICDSAIGQYQYSNTDRAAILKNRAAGKNAFTTYDRIALYKAGYFFESIFKKYNDTSINAAINFYKASVFSEGELYGDSYKAAFRLGQLYETGMGIPVNLDKAAAYYLVSGEQGKASLYQVIKKICPSDTVLHDLSGAPLNDSVVIRFHPFCQLQQTTAMAVLDRLVSYLKANPNMGVAIKIVAPEEFITSYYEYWKRTLAFERVSNQVKHILVDQGISIDRFVPLVVETSDMNTMFALTIHLTDSY